MNEIVPSGFVKPYPQEALGGELGLSSREIALSIGAEHDNVTRAIRAYISLDSQFPHSEGKERARGGRQGRQSTVFVLPAQEAKLIVAQYKSKVGIGYVRFLLECEKVATELTPKLIEELKAARAELGKVQAELDAKKVRALPAPKTVLRTKEFITGESMFGEGFTIKRKMERVPAGEMNLLQVLEAKLTLAIYQGEGTSKRIKRLQDEIEFRRTLVNAPISLVKEVK